NHSNVKTAYLNSIEKEVLNKSGVPGLKIVYDPLYGTGRAIVPEMLKKLGVAAGNIYVVPEHSQANGDFPGLMGPNPSEEGALDRAIEIAIAQDADIVISNDGDADRTVIAIKDGNNNWVKLTANQLGTVLLYYRIEEMKSQGMPLDGVVVESFVTSDIIEKIAESFGIDVVETNVGNKFLVDVAERLGALLTVEESDHIALDGVLAAAMVAELAAAKNRAVIPGKNPLNGMSIWQILNKAYETFGYYYDSQLTLACDGPKGQDDLNYAKENLPDVISEVINEISADLPGGVNSAELISVEYMYGAPIFRIKYILTTGGEINFKVTVRGSGNEAKGRFYIQADKSTTSADLGPDRLQVDAFAADLLRRIRDRADYFVKLRNFSSVDIIRLTDAAKDEDSNINTRRAAMDEMRKRFINTDDDADRKIL
ncbi:MAG: hypothetical protein Q8R48_05605, partial [Candidatus Omnitrophota bacterium]|nr:hypothetical protein [Candidatus Omnitrophota bacterium]